MKELSIEEKAKVYDDTIERARRMFSEKELNYLFPELAESDDERIRKEILDYVNKATGCQRWVAWLEKQCNTNIFDVPKISIKNAVEVTSRMQYIDDDIKPIAEFIMDYANWNLHKDEWNKPTLTVPLFRVLDALIQKGKPYCVCNQNIEKQGDQKPDDKNKPKFKVGDWVVRCDTMAQILDIQEQYYIGLDINGKDFTSSRFLNDNKIHIWTISDAKDGDVLAVTMYPEGTWIGIFKEQNGCTFSTYCFLNTVGTFKRGTYGHGNGKAIHPATKEQRDILLKAMSDAGYTFDFDKKELKEIEDEEYNDEDYGIDGLWHAKNILEKTLGAVEGYQTDDGIIDHKCAITAVDKLYKNSIAWSEEDKHWMQKVIDFMNHPDLIKATPTLAKDTINWLKSLKDRVQPQSKQEWSKEDESNFHGIIDVIKENKHHAIDYEHMTYYKLLSWFKSLKERYVWKPSDEHIHWLKWVINRMPDTEKANEAEVVLKDLLEQLEEL